MHTGDLLNCAYGFAQRQSHAAEGERAGLSAISPPPPHPERLSKPCVPLWMALSSEESIRKFHFSEDDEDDLVEDPDNESENDEGEEELNPNFQFKLQSNDEDEAISPWSMQDALGSFQFLLCIYSVTKKKKKSAQSKHFLMAIIGF